MAQDIGLLLRGLGSAFSNTVPQFRQEMAQEQEARYLQQQREQEAEYLRQQRASEAQMRAYERQELINAAFAKDVMQGQQLLQNGDFQSLFNLALDTAKTSEMLGVPTRPSAEIAMIASRAMAGDAAAIGELDQKLNSYAQQYQRYITEPEMRETIVKPGETVLRGGEPIFTAPMEPKPPEIPAALQTLQARAQAAGLQEGTPEYQEFFRTGGTQGGFNINVPPATPPAGYMNEYDERGNFIGVKPTPGGPVDTARRQAQQTQQRYSDVVLEDIGRYKALISGESVLKPVTGFTGAVAANIAGTRAFDAAQLADTISAGIAFDRLQAMRESSPTGGALGAVTERELDLLKSSLGSISQSQSQDQLLQNLSRLEEIYSGIMQKFSAYPSSQSVQSSPNSDPLGIL